MTFSRIFLDETKEIFTFLLRSHKNSIFLQQHNDDDDLFALAEKNLSLLGPLHEAVKLIGKRPIERENREPRHIELPPIEGPKTRGASKRRHAEAPVTGKKQKLYGNSVKNREKYQFLRKKIRNFFYENQFTIFNFARKFSIFSIEFT